LKHLSIRSAALSALFVAALLACIVPTRAGAEVVDKIVAVINDSIITMSELNAATAMKVERLGGGAGADAKTVAGVKEEILEDLIRQKLVRQAADKAGIDVSEREIDNAIEDIKKQNNGMTREELMLALARSGLTYSEYREQLKEQIRQVKFINREFRSRISIQPDDVENYYRQHIADFRVPPAYRIGIIMIGSSDPGLMKKRLAVVEEELAKGTPFAELARQYSDGPAASAGGDLGYLSLGEMNEIIRDAATSLEPGKVSRAIMRPEGAYLIKLTARLDEAARPLAEVGAEIRDILFARIMDERFNFWLDEVKKQAHIEIRL